MKILALESSGLVAGAAVVKDGILIAEYTVNYKKTHSQTLVPMLNEIKNMTELELASLDAVAVSAGPGSFTGLRIGSATAKGLGLALGLPIVAVPTVDALAYVLYGARDVVCPLMDARRGQVYSGIYEFYREKEVSRARQLRGQSYSLRALRKQCATPIEEITRELNRIGREVIFLGDGAAVFAERLSQLLDVPYSFAPPHMNRQRAAAVAALAEIYMEEGRIQTAAGHTPEYLRLSQAERERLEAGKSIDVSGSV